MKFIALLGALFTILSAGFGGLHLIRDQNWRINLVTQLALSWIFGTGIVSLLIWVFGFFSKGAWLASLVAAICIALPLLARRRRKLPAPSWPSFQEPRLLKCFFGATLTIELAIIFYLSCVHTLGGDGLLNWEIKARYAYADGGVLPLTYLQDISRSFSHPQYPLAIPYTELWLYFWLGDAHQFWAKIIFPIFYAAGAVLLVTIGTRFTGRTSAGFVAALLLFFIPQIAVEPGSAIVGYADFPLSVLYLATIGFLLCACQKDDPGSFRIYAVCLALLPWMKNEGAILWLIAAGCGVLVVLKEKKSLLHLLALLPGLFVIATWRIYLSQTHAVAPPDFLPVNLRILSENFYRLGPILSELFSEFTHLRDWSLFWILGAIAGAFFLARHRDFRSVMLVLAVLVPIGLDALIYLFSDWPNYLAHVKLSLSRLLIHVTPLAALILSATVSFSFLPLRQSQRFR
jgi:hypothetical protein